MSPSKKRKMSNSGVPSGDDIKDDERWRDGDFEIISFDDVCFKVPSYYIQAHSSVLRDALSIGVGEKRIHFTDPHCERSSTVTHFLTLASEGSLAVDAFHSLEAYTLVLFLQKWDCAALLRVLLTQLRDQLRCRERCHLLLAFVIGAVADDEKTCLVALSQPPGRWKGTLTRTDGAPHAQSLDPTAFPIWASSMLPYSYSWALSRAWNAVGKTHTTKLPAEFSRYLAAAKKWEGEKRFTEMFR